MYIAEYFKELFCCLYAYCSIVGSEFLFGGGEVVTVLETLYCFDCIEVVVTRDCSLGVEGAVLGEHGLEFSYFWVIDHSCVERFGEEDRWLCGEDGGYRSSDTGRPCLGVKLSEATGRACTAEESELVSREGADEPRAYGETCGSEGFRLVLVLELDDGALGGRAKDKSFLTRGTGAGGSNACVGVLVQKYLEVLYINTFASEFEVGGEGLPI